MLRELNINKKAKKKIVGSGYKNTVEWTTRKLKIFIFVDCFAVAPIVFGLLVALWEYIFITDPFQRKMIPLEAFGAGICLAVFTWAPAIIYYKHVRYNSRVPYERYFYEQLFCGENQFVFRENNGTQNDGDWIYTVQYTEIDELVDCPNVKMIQIKGNFCVELFQKDCRQIYNQDHSIDKTISIGYYYDGIEKFKKTLSEKTGLSFKVIDY